MIFSKLSIPHAYSLPESTDSGRIYPYRQKLLHDPAHFHYLK